MASSVPTLLSTLKAFLQLQERRTSLSVELDSALSSFLTNTPTALETLSPNGASSSTCAEEAIRPPNEDELGEILRIGMGGLLECKDESKNLEETLKLVWAREDLAKAVGRIEDLETERLKETLKRDQLRRLAVLDPADDFSEAIATSNSIRQKLAAEINEEMLEIKAEVVDLSAAEEA